MMKLKYKKYKKKKETLLFYSNKYEKGVYYKEENLLYIDKENSSFLYELSISTGMQNKSITPVQREKLKTLTLVRENPYKTFLYKFFLEHSRIAPPCFSLAERVLHLDDFEFHLKNLNEWIETIHFIHDSLSDDPVKQIVLIQKSKDVLSWNLRFQDIKAYKDEFKRILNYLQSEFEIKKPVKPNFPKSVSKEIKNFGFTEKQASVIYQELRKTILNDNVEKDVFISALTEDWNKVEGKINLTCETSEFAALINEFNRRSEFKNLFTNAKIETSKLFISKQGRVILSANLRSSKGSSEGRGSYQEKKDEMSVHIDRIVGQIS